MRARGVPTCRGPAAGEGGERSAAEALAENSTLKATGDVQLRGAVGRCSAWRVRHGLAAGWGFGADLGELAHEAAGGPGRVGAAGTADPEELDDVHAALA